MYIITIAIIHKMSDHIYVIFVTRVYRVRFIVLCGPEIVIVIKILYNTSSNKRVKKSYWDIGITAVLTRIYTYDDAFVYYYV